MWTIYTNAHITRRKTFHLVADDQDEVQFRSSRFWECVEYLDALDITEYQISPGHPAEVPDVPPILVKRKP